MSGPEPLEPANAADPSVEVQLAIYEDARDFAGIFARSWEAAYRGLLPDAYINERNAARREQFERTLSDENRDVYALRIGGANVGAMKLAPPADGDTDPADREIYYLYVHPDSFGRGAGTAVIRYAAEKARAEGAERISVWALKGNERALRFYRNRGFAPDGRSKTADRGGVAAESVRLILTL